MNRNIFKISYMIHSITHVYDTQWYTHHCNVVTNVESKFQNSTIVRQPYGNRTIKVHLSLRSCDRVDRADLKRFKSRNDFVDVHRLFIKSIFMLDTLSLSINEMKTITKKSIRTNSKSLQQCMIAILLSQNSKSSRYSIFFSFYLLIRFVFSSRAFSLSFCFYMKFDICFKDVAKTTFDFENQF